MAEKKVINSSDTVIYNEQAHMDFVLSEDIIKEDPQTRVLQLQSGQEYVDFILSGSRLGRDLYNCFISNETHQRIILSKNSLMCGQGFDVYETKHSTLTGLAKPKLVTGERLKKLGEFLDGNVSGDGKNFHEVLIEVGLDFLLYGNCFVNLKPTEIDAKATLLVKKLGFTDCKPKFANKKTGLVEQIAFNEYFALDQDANGKVIEFKKYHNVGDSKTESGGGCIYHLMNKYPQNFYYGLPDYIGGKLSLSSNYKARKYNDTQIENNFNPSAAMTVIGEYTQTEADELTAAIKKKFVGTGKNSGLFIQVTNDPEAKVEIEQIEKQQDGSYKNTMAETNLHTFISHGYAQSLLGILHSGALGDTDRIKQEFEIFKHTDLNPLIQKLEKFINAVIREAAEVIDGADWKDWHIKINSKMPIVEKIVLSEILTINEQRAILGYEPLEEMPQPTNEGE